MYKRQGQGFTALFPDGWHEITLEVAWEPTGPGCWYISTPGFEGVCPVGPVSYTHLDVYKRQGLGFSDLGTLLIDYADRDIAGVVGITGDQEGIREDVAVSYTHLDVYKRQKMLLEEVMFT